MRGLDLLLDLLYPRRCPICQKIVVPKGNDICQSCFEELPFIGEPRCKKCGKPLGDMEKEYCYDCEKRAFHYEYGYGIWIYDEKMKRSLSAFKYQGKREYAEFYGQQLLQHYGDWIQSVGIQVVVPVPVHKSKLKIRGYNQAELIAGVLAKELSLPLEEVLMRCVNTKPQKSLDNRERIYNLQHAFSRNKYNKFPVKGKIVLLIDDIYTTGSTIEVCTNVLRQDGASKVYFLCLCIGKGF